VRPARLLRVVWLGGIRCLHERVTIRAAHIAVVDMRVAGLPAPDWAPLVPLTPDGRYERQRASRHASRFSVSGVALEFVVRHAEDFLLDERQATRQHVSVFESRLRGDGDEVVQ
jgi:hypothetical protein